MAWRIEQQVVKGELDCRVRGKVTGTLWLAGADAPVRLDLTGCPWRDLAGCFVRITHSSPVSKSLANFANVQSGSVGDITASRKVRVPDGDLEEFIRSKKAAKNWPCHFKNALYLEWFSEANGRVVIESTDYELEMEGEPTWFMTSEEEQAQRENNEAAIQDFMNRLANILEQTAEKSTENDGMISRIEIEADEESARMDLLLDRVDARMNKEGVKPEDFTQIMDDERARLRREKGEPEPEHLTWEQQQERDERIQEMNEIFRQAEEDYENNPEDFVVPSHPLEEACSDLGVRLHKQMKENNWIPESASPEHPLHEIGWGVSLAAAKLAGALHRGPDEGWPPDPLFAGDTLVRLKKARDLLQDALLGLDSADEENLTTPEWRSQARIDIQHILTQVQALIQDVRTSLE